ncbi:MAG: hypothetical protein P8Y70_01805 [Candidatus Lokiarchaeota archaeon]
MLKKIGDNIYNIFGFIIIDEKKSFFQIPLPIETPIAIISTLPDIVAFHLQGMKEILRITEEFKE